MKNSEKFYRTNEISFEQIHSIFRNQYRKSIFETDIVHGIFRNQSLQTMKFLKDFFLFLTEK